MFGHRSTFLDGWEATCTEGGCYSERCKDCNIHVRYSGFAALGHEYEAGTCGTARACIRCGETTVFEHEFKPSENTCMHCGMDKYSITLPEAPIAVNTYDYSGLQKSCQITKIESEMAYSKVKITYTVVSTYHEDGNNHSANAAFAWKLYDSEGVVIDSGKGYSDGAIKVGEQSRGSFEIYFHKLEEGTQYRLEILNIAS